MKASDNDFPSVLVAEGATPAAPAAGSQRVFIDSADHKLKRVNSSGTVTTVESAGGVSSFNTRTGAVTLTKADVTGTGLAASDVSAAPLVESVNTVAASGTAQTIPDPSVQSISRVTLTGNCVFTMPAAAAGKSFTVVLVQDATGSRTSTFTGAKWPGGTAPTLSTAASAVDVLTFLCADGASWLGFLAGKGMA